MANAVDIQKKLELSISKWTEDKNIPTDSRDVYKQLAEAAVQSLNIKVVSFKEPVVPKESFSKVAPIIPPVIMALSAFLGAKLGESWGACAGVLAGAGVVWLVSRYLPKRSQNMQSPISEPDVELDINGDDFDLRLAEIQITQPFSELKENPVFRDLLADEEFHRWIQQFALRVHRKGDYNELQMLMSLKEVLESFGLYIYDELEKDDNGNVVLPPMEDAFMDMRQDDEWTGVAMPAVYTEDKVLLCGVIK